MLNTINDFHAASQVRDAAVASNTHAVELGTRLKMLEKSDGQRGQGAVVQAVRSSPEECVSLPASRRRGVFSRLCRSLFCIRPVLESRTSAVPSPPLALSSSSCNNPAGQLSRSTASVFDDDPAPVVQTIVAGDSRIDEPLLTACPQRKDVQRIFRQVLCLGYRERLSHEWSFCQASSPKVFNKRELAFIDKSKIADDEQFSYMEVDNAFPRRYGSAKIYHAIHPDDSAMPSQLWVIELYGELVPVRTSDDRYEVYRRDKPANTLAVDWDGKRWVSSRHAASLHQASHQAVSLHAASHQAASNFVNGMIRPNIYRGQVMSGSSNTYSNTYSNTSSNTYSKIYSKSWSKTYSKSYSSN